MARRAMTAPADGKRPQPLVTVLVGYQTFRGRVCELADRIVITPGTVASLLDEALIERVVFDGPARVIDPDEPADSPEPCAGPSTSSITAALTRAATCPSSAARATTSNRGHAAARPIRTTASSAARTHTAGGGNTGDGELQHRLRNGRPLTPTSNGARHGSRPGAPDFVPACLQGLSSTGRTASSTRGGRSHPATDRGGPRGGRPRPRPVTRTRRRPRRGWRRACGGSRRAPRGPGHAARRTRRTRPGPARS
jgi:hypothetical protein